MLPAWRPVPSYGSTMIIFVIFGVIFLTLGIALYVMSDKIQEATFNYNTVCGTPMLNGSISICNKQFDIETTMIAPVYVYYQLDNFYQNHRRYVKSRDYKQLMGENRTLADIQKV